MRIKGTDLKKIIKEEISRMNESYYYQKDMDREDDFEEESEADYEFRNGLRFPSSHPNYGTQYDSAAEGKAAYMEWKRSQPQRRPQPPRG